jgi:lysophospholipase L1-like esterase
MRWIFRIAVSLMWLTVACLTFEAIERARVLFSEHRYAQYFQEQNNKVYRMAPAGMGGDTLTNPNATTSANTPLASPRPPAILCPPNAANRDAYAQRGKEERAVIATVRGELHALLTPTFEIKEYWGDPFFEYRFGNWNSTQSTVTFHKDLHGALKNLERGLSTGPLPDMLDDLYPIEAEGFLREGHYPTPDHVELVLREVSPVLVSPNPPVAQSHSTDIPGIRYKRNWFVPGEIASYNNYGFRDVDVVMPKPPGLYRIVCIGGSTTEEGNNNNDTYPNIVERKLQEKLGKERVEVINCGISGITSYNERRRIEDYLELDPDLIVYYNGVNDATHEHMGRWREMAPASAQRLLWSKVLTRVFNRSLLPADDVLRDYMQRTTFRNIRAMAFRAKECGVAFAVCSFAYPAPEQLGFRDRVYLDMNFREVFNGKYLYYPAYTQVMDLHNALAREICKIDDLLYLPVAEELQVGMDHFFDLCHMTPEGMALKTDIIARLLQPIVEGRKN